MLMDKVVSFHSIMSSEMRHFDVLAGYLSEPLRHAVQLRHPGSGYNSNSENSTNKTYDTVSDLFSIYSTVCNKLNFYRIHLEKLCTRTTVAGMSFVCLKVLLKC
jgi:hypothetical protein